MTKRRPVLVTHERKCANGSAERERGPEVLIEVECYAGYRGEETPRTIVLGERRISVADVIDRWLAPDHRYFKIRGDDGHVYIVRQDVESGDWVLTMFERGPT